MKKKDLLTVKELAAELRMDLVDVSHCSFRL